MKKYMTLLFILTRFPGYGGIENVTKQMINYLSLVGYTCLIVSYLKGNKNDESDTPPHFLYAIRNIGFL